MTSRQQRTVCQVRVPRPGLGGLGQLLRNFILELYRFIVFGSRGVEEVERLWFPVRCGVWCCDGRVSTGCAGWWL